MKLDCKTPGQTLNKAYAKQTVQRKALENFSKNLAVFFKHLQVDEYEENLKNLIADLLKDTWYKQTNHINTWGNIDLAIYGGSSYRYHQKRSTWDWRVRRTTNEIFL